MSTKHAYPKDYTPTEVLDLLGYSYDARREESQIPCPSACMPPLNGRGHMKGDFNINLTSGIGRCFRCGYTGNAIQIYATSIGLSTKEAYKEILQRLGRWNEKGEPRKKTIERKVETENVYLTTPIAQPEYLAQTYAALIDVLSLSEAHKKGLLARGITEESIVLEGYRSFPNSEVLRNNAVAGILSKGCHMEGIPGFYRKEGTWEMSQYSNGILVPYRNVKGEILSMQVRLDKPFAGNKYLTFSSTDNPEGTRGVAAYHLCGRMDNNRTLIITEGAIKGRAIVDLLGGCAMVLAIPGVTMIRDMGTYLKDVQTKYHFRRILIAYDMDEAVNSQVIRASKSLMTTCMEAGYEVQRLAWDAGKIRLAFNFHPIADQLKVCPKVAFEHALAIHNIADVCETQFMDEGITGIIIATPEHPTDTFRIGKVMIGILDAYRKAYEMPKKPIYEICLKGDTKGLDDYLLKQKLFCNL